MAYEIMTQTRGKEYQWRKPLRASLQKKKKEEDEKGLKEYRLCWPSSDMTKCFRQAWGFIPKATVNSSLSSDGSL